MIYQIPWIRCIRWIQWKFPSIQEKLDYFACRTYGATAAVVFCYSFSCILLRNVPEKGMLGDEAVRRVSTVLEVVAPEI